MKKTFLWLVVIITLVLVGCDQQASDIPIAARDSSPVEATVTAEPAPAVEEDETSIEIDESVVEAAGPEVFVPIAVEEFGLTTVVPADWPQIESDPLLKNAWGPGEFRFVAFHSVPGEDVQPAMAQLLGISLEELVESPPEGEYWEEQIGSYDWAMYTVDNPDIGLGQSVSMTTQDGTVYIVSLFVEMDYRDAVLNAVLENFNITSEAALDEVEPEASEEELTEVEEAAEVEEGPAIELLGTNWVLTMLGDGNGQLQEVLPGVEITAVFKADDRAAGSAGCNDFVSNYMVEDDSMAISVPAMTRKICDDPEGIMLQETGFLSSLTAVTSHQIAANELQMLNTDGDVILVFSSP